LIPWRNTLEKINEELRQTNAKKQALEELYNSGKISQTTYENFNKELTETLEEIQVRRENLLRRISKEALVLEQKIGELETFLVNCEILHASGEMEETLYQNEIKLWTTGLETIKGELNELKETMNNIQTNTSIASVQAPPQSPTPASVATCEGAVKAKNLEVKNDEVTLIENVENISTPVSTNEECKADETPIEVKVEEQPTQTTETASSFRQEEKATEETTT